MKLTKDQKLAITMVATRTRCDAAEIGWRTVGALIKRGLIEKDWSRNDFGGEAVVLTQAGREIARKLYQWQ